MLDLLNKQFFDLIVLKQIIDGVSINGAHYSRWECLCTCGRVIEVRGSDLTRKRNSVKRCKACRNKLRSLPEGEAGFNKVLSMYHSNAENNNRKFELSDKQARSLFQSNCGYCGAPPSQSAQSTGRLNGDFLYNGIDRMDNSKDYVLNNCISCCGPCNLMKHILGPIEFLARVKKIYEYRQLGGTNS